MSRKFTQLEDHVSVMKTLSLNRWVFLEMGSSFPQREMAAAVCVPTAFVGYVPSSLPQGICLQDSAVMANLHCHLRGVQNDLRELLLGTPLREV